MKNLIAVISVLSVATWIIVLRFNGMSSQNSLAWQLGELTGFTLWAALFAYGVSKFVKRKHIPYGLISFSILFSLIAGTKTFYVRQETVVTKDAKVALLELMEAESLQIDEKLEQNPSSEKYGDMNAILQMMDRTMANRIKDVEKYNQKVEGAGLDQLFNSANLGDQMKRLELVEKLNALVAEISILDLNLKRSLEDLYENLAQISNEEMRNGLKAGFKQGSAHTQFLCESYVAIEKEFLQTAIELIEFMNIKEGLFWEEDNLLCFAEEADANSFNQRIEKIREVVEKEEAITCKMKDVHEQIFRIFGLF